MQIGNTSSVAMSGHVHARAREEKVDKAAPDRERWDVRIPVSARFAIYDLDRTITRLPTWSRFLLFAMRKHAPWRAIMIPAVGASALAYSIGLIDRKRLKESMQRLLIGRKTVAAVIEHLAQAFADREVKANILVGARNRIEADRDSGFQVVIATAAHDFYARAIAARLGIHDVLATRAIIDTDGHILARIDGENCYGLAKHRRIAEWVAAQAPGRADVCVRFYSDHLSDLPTLAWADQAVVVNPGRALRHIARYRRWPIADWIATAP